MISHRHLLVALTILGALALLGCGSSDDRGDGPEAGGQPAPGERGQRSASGQGPGTMLRGVRSGDRLVFFGDSLAIAGSTPYPDRLASALGVEVANLSEPGTTSTDWRPGGERFERLRAELPGADLVLVTLGGNDLEAALGGRDGPDALGRIDAAGALGRLARARRSIERNLMRTFAAIRRGRGAPAIVYVGYPDYSASERWRAAGGALGAAGLRLGLGALTESAREAGPDLVVDMTGATARRDVDRLLSDGEHLSDRGHGLYARRIARALRG